MLKVCLNTHHLLLENKQTGSDLGAGLPVSCEQNSDVGRQMLTLLLCLHQTGVCQASSHDRDTLGKQVFSNGSKSVRCIWIQTCRSQHLQLGIRASVGRVAVALVRSATGCSAATWQLTGWKQIGPAALRLSITSQQYGGGGRGRPKGQRCHRLQPCAPGRSHYC